MKIADSVRATSLALRALEEIFETLGSDVTMSQKMLKKTTKPFWRRTLVRSLFACIEGINHHMKSVAIGLAEVNSVKLTRAEYAFLREETYNLTDKGDAKVELRSRLRTADNLLFTLKTTARAAKSSYPVDKASEDWCSFKEALRIRHRITHPKSSGDLELSDAELRVVQKTIKWYFTSVNDVLSIMVKLFNDLLKGEQFKKSF